MIPRSALLLPVRTYLRVTSAVFARNLHATHHRCSSVRVLYDGECPICVKEINFLQFLQKNRPEKVDFVDISLQGYDGDQYGGISYEKAMEEMHVIDKDDQVHIGVPAFNVMYTAVGLGWVGRLITWPYVRPLMDKAYAVFAKNRLKWTGRDECTTGRCVKKSD